MTKKQNKNRIFLDDKTDKIFDKRWFSYNNLADFVCEFIDTKKSNRDVVDWLMWFKNKIKL